MKSRLDFETDEDYKKYLLIYFSGHALTGLAAKQFSFDLQSESQVIESSIWMAKTLIAELEKKAALLDVERQPVKPIYGSGDDPIFNTGGINGYGGTLNPENHD